MSQSLDSEGGSFDGSESGNMEISDCSDDFTMSKKSMTRSGSIHESNPFHETDNYDSPIALIVTNVHLSVFNDSTTKEKFQCLFREFDNGCVFHFLPSFRRIRVTFNSHLSASRAKVHLDKSIINDSIIHCYFVQIGIPGSFASPHLRLPPTKKQFLISPPSSPPVGWQQPAEGKPVVDSELIEALSKLNPGDVHELVPRNQVKVLGKSISTPSIVIQLEKEGDCYGYGMNEKSDPCLKSTQSNSMECGGSSASGITELITSSSSSVRPCFVVGSQSLDNSDCCDTPMTFAICAPDDDSIESIGRITPTARPPSSKDISHNMLD